MANETEITLNFNHTIVIKRRLHADPEHRYYVYVKGNKGMWSCGASQQEAIGDLVGTHGQGK